MTHIFASCPVKIKIKIMVPIPIPVEDSSLLIIQLAIFLVILRKKEWGGVVKNM